LIRGKAAPFAIALLFLVTLTTAMFSIPLGYAGRLNALNQATAYQVDLSWSGDGEDYQSHLTYIKPLSKNITQSWLDLIKNLSTPPTAYVDKFGWKTFKLAFQFSNLNTSNPVQHNLNFSIMDGVLSTLYSEGFDVILSDYDWAGFGSSVWVQDWINVTLHYKGDQRILAFDLFNEPSMGTWSKNVTTYQYNSTESVESAYSNATQAIHHVDPKRLVFWYTPYIQWKLFPKFEQSGVLYDFHVYANESMNSVTKELNDVLAFDSQYNTASECLELNAQGSAGINFTLSDQQISLLISKSIPWIAWLYTSYPQYWIPILNNVTGVSNESTSTSTTSDKSSTSTTSSYSSQSSHTSSTTSIPSTTTTSITISSQSTLSNSTTASSSEGSTVNGQRLNSTGTVASDSEPAGNSQANSSSSFISDENGNNSYFTSDSTTDLIKSMRNGLEAYPRVISGIAYGVSTSITILMFGSVPLFLSLKRRRR
jgi:hypothetical protein